MVDVTVLLYLPINTSLDDLAFVADWGQKIVSTAEEKMIVNGKNTRYLRQRVMPMMYNPNNSIRPVNKPKIRENTESWLNRLRQADKEALPSWVKSHNLIDDDPDTLREKERELEQKAKELVEAEEEKLKKQNAAFNPDCLGNHSDGLCDCPINRKNYLDVIREAVQFTYPTPEYTMNSSTSFNGSQSNLLDSDTDDSIFSDASTESDEEKEIDAYNPSILDPKLKNHPHLNALKQKKKDNNQQNKLNRKISIRNSNKNKNNSLLGSSESIDSNNSNNSNNSSKSKYSSYRAETSGQNNLSNNEILKNTTYHQQQQDQDLMKNLKCKSNSRDSLSANSDIGSLAGSNTSSRLSTHTISHNKHVILSVAMGYDRDSMKEVRKVINETGVALLSVGIGDRGMIGLGGYYIKKLHELESKSLQDKIVNRLWNLA
jgi:hypothetical protein